MAALQACPGPDRRPKTPRFIPPPGACDCHAHVFGPAAIFPFSPERSYTPEDCTVEDYAGLLDALGFSRGVIVHGGAHGTDNRATLNALARLGERVRGVAVIRAGLPDTEVQAMHEAGMRGCRISTVVRGGANFTDMEALAAQTAPLRWHLVLHLHRSDELVELAPRLRRIGNDFVLDHLGRITAQEGERSAAFRTLLDLLDTGRCWVKLASLYRLSSVAYPHRDMLPMIHRVVAARPDRIIWGSNWPHPIHTGPMPNDGDLVDLIPLWVPDAGERQKMLVDNPETLYGFSPRTRERPPEGLRSLL